MQQRLQGRGGGGGGGFGRGRPPSGVKVGSAPKFAFGMPPPNVSARMAAPVASGSGSGAGDMSPSATCAGPIRRAPGARRLAARMTPTGTPQPAQPAQPMTQPPTFCSLQGRLGAPKHRSIQQRLGSRIVGGSQQLGMLMIPQPLMGSPLLGPVIPSREVAPARSRVGGRDAAAASAAAAAGLFAPFSTPPPMPPPPPPPRRAGAAAAASTPTPALGPRCPSPRLALAPAPSPAAPAPSHQSLAPPIIECFQEYDIPQMEARADRFSEVGLLKRRAERFEEEVASELVQPKVAERKNRRFRRFMEDEDDDDEEEEEEDDEDDDDQGEIAKLLNEKRFGKLSIK